MNLEEKKNALVNLGQFFESSLLHAEGQAYTNDSQEYNALISRGSELIQTACQENAWFTPDSVKSVYMAWSESLKNDKVDQWLKPYQDILEQKDSTKQVGVIMAGNLPLVGLHDALCVLVSGHELKAKLSSKDSVLMSLVFDVLQLVAPEWGNKIEIVDKLNNIDFLIATGSDNSARYFDYYFKDVKRIIRKNRTSVALLSGEEAKSELDQLAEDVFTHFGLGCRNVTKVYLPKNFDLDRLFEAFFKYKDVAEHNKYANNYDYNKAVYLMNKIELIENGFLLLKEDEGLHSPLAVLFYEYYDDLDNVLNKLNQQQESIQCIVGHINKQSCIPFGEAQKPELWDYSDGIDTISFLIENE